MPRSPSARRGSSRLPSPTDSCCSRLVSRAVITASPLTRDIAEAERVRRAPRSRRPERVQRNIGRRAGRCCPRCRPRRCRGCSSWPAGHGGRRRSPVASVPRRRCSPRGRRGSSTAIVDRVTPDEQPAVVRPDTVVGQEHVAAPFEPQPHRRGEERPRGVDARAPGRRVAAGRRSRVRGRQTARRASIPAASVSRNMMPPLVHAATFCRLATRVTITQSPVTGVHVVERVGGAPDVGAIAPYGVGARTVAGAAGRAHRADVGLRPDGRQRAARARNREPAGDAERRAARRVVAVHADVVIGAERRRWCPRAASGEPGSPVQPLIAVKVRPLLLENSTSKRSNA